MNKRSKKIFPHLYTLMLTAIIAIILDFIYFRNMTLSSPIIDSDFGPFPNQGILTSVTYFGIFRVVNIPMQNIVGNGSPNLLSPFFLIESLLSIVLQNPPFSQLIFFLMVSVLSATGMTYLIFYLNEGKILAILGGIIYAFAPLLIINFIAGGNPSATWWYATIPWFLLASLRSMDRPGIKNYLLLTLTVLVTSLLSNESLFLSIILFSIPISIIALINKRRAILNVISYFAYILLGLLFITFIFYFPSLSTINSITGTLSSSSTFQAYLNTLSNPIQTLFYEAPNFGFQLYKSPFYVAYVPKQLLNVDGIIGVVLFVVLFISRKKLPQGVLSLLTAIYVFPYVLLLLLFSSLGSFMVKNIPYIYAIANNYYVVPTVLSMTLVIIFALRISVEFLKETGGKKMITFVEFSLKTKSDTGDVSTKRYGLIRLPRIRKEVTIAVLLVLLASVIAPIIISDVDSGGYIHEVDKLQPETYVPLAVSYAAAELSVLKSQFGMNYSRDLWGPVNGIQPLISAITYADSQALFYPSENVLSFSTASSLQDSYTYLYYVLAAILNNEGENVGKLLQPLGVGFIVVIKNLKFNDPFENATSQEFQRLSEEPLFVSSSLDAILGNSSQLQKILNKEPSMKLVSNTTYFAIYLNQLYSGQLYGYHRVLLSFNSMNSSDYVNFESSTIWNNSPPVITNDSLNGLEDNYIIPLQYNNLTFISNFAGLEYFSPSFLSHYIDSSQNGSVAGNYYVSIATPDKISFELPVDISTVSVGYSGIINTDGNGTNQVSSSNNQTICTVNISSDGNHILDISGTGRIYYVAGTGTASLDAILQSLTPVKLEYTIDGAAKYRTTINENWIYLTNTFSRTLSSNSPSVTFASINGMSLILVNGGSNITLYYSGISPQIFQLFGILGYVLSGLIFGLLIVYITKRLEKKSLGRGDV